MNETPAFRQTRGDCPPHDVWGAVCIGGLPEGEAETYLTHASHCPICSVLLRQASETLAETEKPEETEELRRFESSSPAWQEKMAHQLAESVLADLERKPLPSRNAWRFWRPRFSWQIAACALLIVVSGSIWFWYSVHHSPGRLIAQAYDENRTLELRIPGARYSPLQPSRVMRDGSSVPEQPASLLEARGMIAHQLERDPMNPKWLELEARAHLLDGDLDHSLETTNHLLLLHPTDHDLLLDSAIAYFERGQLSDNPQDIGTAVDLLGRLLAQYPNDSVALYNQAVALEHLYQYNNAIRTWKTFLGVEKDSGWRADGQKHLEALEAKLKAREGYIENTPLSNSQIFSMAMDKSKIPKLDEELSTTQLPELLKAAYPEPPATCTDSCSPARIVLSALADSLKAQHNDPWLYDLILTQGSDDWTRGVRALADAIQANTQGRSADGLRAANTAITSFQAANSPVGEMRARVEQVYADQRLLDGRDCLQDSEELDKELKGTPYVWMQGQFAVDYSSCYAIENRFDEEKALLEKVQPLIGASHYHILALRAQGILAASDTDLGDYEAAWKKNLAGLHDYWSGRYPSIRGYQFYNDLAYIEEGRSRGYLSLYLSQEALAVISPLNMLAVEAFNRIRVVQALIGVGNEKEAENELQQSEAKFPHLANADQFRSYIAEGLISLANLKIERHEINGANKLLQRAEVQLSGDKNPRMKFAMISTRGSLLMQSGEWRQALAILSTAVQVADVERAHLQSADERISWLRQMESIYAGLALSNFEVTHDPEQSLALWERYRGQLLGSGYALHCLQSDPDCIHAAILREKSVLKNGALIGNIVYDHGVLVWRVDQQGVSMHFVPIPRHELLKKVKAFTQLVQMSKESDEDIRNYGRELFRVLIGPVWHGHDAGQLVYLEPDASLSSLPFAALPFLDSYWGLVSPLAHVVSMLEDDPRRSDTKQQLLANMRTGRALIIGNPKVPDAIAPPLPDAAEEARAISGLFPHSTLLIGDEAQRDTVLNALPSVSVFHFAGHTQSWSSRTRLLLAGAAVSPDASALAHPASIGASDILQFPPKRCLLAVLSACSTGNRDSLDADVVSDIVSSFAEAGVPQIIATHWSVDSAYSSGLMRSFYTQLMMGAPVPIALEKAQTQLVANGYKQPRYWASFYAVGFGNTN